MADAGSLYAVVATAYQLLLAALLLAVGRPDAFRAGVVVILGASAFETWFVSPIVPPLVPEWLAGDVLDPVIVMTIAYLLSRAPSPIGGERGARWAFRTWIGAILAWAILAPSLRAMWGIAAVEAGKFAFQTTPFLVAGVLVALRVVPRWLELPPGPLRGQTLLAGAGLSVGLGSVGFRNVDSLLAGEPQADPALAFSAAALSTLALLVVLAAARLAVAAVRSGRRDAAAFSALLLVGVGVFAANEYATLGFGEFATQVVRPILLAAAGLRYDLFRVPPALRRILVPASGVALVVATFFALTATLSRGRSGLDPTLAALVLVMITGSAMLLRDGIAKALRSAGGEGSDPDRIDRYRLALEQGVAGAPLERLRASLRITAEEHDTLAAILARHVVVPARSIRGVAPGEVVADRYEVVRELGSGGQGRATLAFDRETGTRVVLKQVLRPWEEGADARRAAFERERRVGAAVSSPRVARVLGTAVDHQITFLVREYVEGEALDEVLRRGPVPPERSMQIIRDVIEGLGSLHAAGLLHLDVKPQNIVLDRAGRAVLIDAGAVRAEPERATLQRTVAPGTLDWMAPEHARGGPVDARSDVYSAGLLLRRLVAVPSPGVAAAVRRATAEDPAGRFASAAEFRAALADA